MTDQLQITADIVNLTQGNSIGRETLRVRIGSDIFLFYFVSFRFVSFRFILFYVILFYFRSEVLEVDRVWS